VLGFARSPDALVDGCNVVVQKAQTSAFLSNPAAPALLDAATDPVADTGQLGATPLDTYAGTTNTYLDPTNTALGTGIGWSTTAAGAISRPYFPDGQNANGQPNGPLSKPASRWNVFNTGLQLDATLADFAVALCPNVQDLRDVLENIPPPLIPPTFDPNDPTTCPPAPTTCSDITGLGSIDNGTTYFPGGFPIYRLNGGALEVIGGIGVSGDGVEQNDSIAFLGLRRAGREFGDRFGHAPKSVRANTLSRDGVFLRYAICPVKPFLGSDVQNACEAEDDL